MKTEGWPIPKQRRMPIQKPGKSEQVVCTPKEFLEALKRKLGISEFDCDLAASDDNAVCTKYYTEEQNALFQRWNVGEDWNLCNPPYADLASWVRKARDETYTGARTAMLVPASVGSNWWYSFVDGWAHVLFLNGRITFVGHKSPYPKDLAILLYSRTVYGGYEVWDWRTE